MADHSHFKPEYCNVVETYLKNCSNENQRLPKRCDVARLLKCDEDTLANWSKVNASFGALLREVDLAQKSLLIDGGFYGGKEVNPRLAQFLLSANHGMVETSKNEVTGANGKDLIPSEIRINIMQPDKA